MSMGFMTSPRLHAGLTDRRSGLARREEPDQPFRVLDLSRFLDDGRREHLDQLNIVRKRTDELDPWKVYKLAHRRERDVGLSGCNHRSRLRTPRHNLR